MKRAIVFLAVLLTLTTCGSDNDVLLTPLPEPSFTFADGVDRINLVASPVDDYYQYDWTSSSSLTFIQSSDRNSFYFKIPPTIKTGSTDVTLMISDGEQSRTVTNLVPVPPYTATRAYGLGTSVEAERSNNRDYEWYIDQGTSTYPTTDCGPTSVTMAIKWFDEGFTGTPAMARATYNSEGGWWSTTDIYNYMKDKKATCYYVNFFSERNLLVELDAGNILILCLDMYYVSNEIDNENRTNKFYETAATGWGHFIVVKGYKKVQTPDGEKLYMEAYDPYSLGKQYADNTLKGRNRYYLASDLVNAGKNWWPYAIVASKNYPETGRIGLDPANIPVQSGR